jgi:hypothetical protein
MLSLLQPKPPISIFYGAIKMELLPPHPAIPERATTSEGTTHSTSQPIHPSGTHARPRHALALVPCNPNQLPRPPIM